MNFLMDIIDKNKDFTYELKYCKIQIKIKILHINYCLIKFKLCKIQTKIKVFTCKI